ncbi:MAG TPA: AAA family ATPase [bacterium]|nr:AAA family ATPase [bacterium]
MEEIKKLEELRKAKEEIMEQMHKVIIGQDAIIEKILIGLFSGGHCLLIGVPGLAKTLMVKTLSQILDLSFKRIQFTPDLMPSDITGTEVIQEDTVSRERILKFLPGPVFANLILADEINRAPPKTQAALLEAMQEYQVTVGGKKYSLPQPFLVLATQNPIELEGTYPLPEAQLDRFMLSIYMDYPSKEEEKKIAEITPFELLSEVNKVLDSKKIIEFQRLIRKIPVSDYVVNYGVNLVRSTRPNLDHTIKFVKEYVSWGAGPRATQYLILAAKAKAALRGDVNVSISDIKEVSVDVLRHRVFTNFNADADGVNSDTIIKRLLEEIPE